MNTKNRLNCYVFSNLIISFLSLNLLINNQQSSINLISQKGISSLKEIYVLETNTLNNEINNSKPTTIVVSNKVHQSKNTTTINYIKPSYNKITGTNLVNYSKHYLGLRYVSGGNSLETGTDCSGFTKLIFKEFGISLGRTVNSQMYSGSYVSKSDLQPGDLVFYGNYSNYASHVAIYIGNNLVIHESNPNDGVKISPLNMMVYITARRVIFENVTSNQENVIEDKKETIIENDNDLNNEIVETEKKEDTSDIVVDKENNSNESNNLPDNNNNNIDDDINNNNNNNNINTDDNINIDEKDDIILEENKDNPNNIIDNENTSKDENLIDNNENITEKVDSSILENNEIIKEENTNLSIISSENTDTNLEKK